MSKHYWVITHDGQAYGPADAAVLSQWAREGRLTALSVLQDAATNQRMQARQVPELHPIFGASAVPPQAGTEQRPGYQQPIGHQQQNTAIPAGIGLGFETTAPHQPYQPYQQPIGYQSVAAPLNVPLGANAHRLTSFSPAAVVLLDLVTGGLFSMIHFHLMHDKMPRLRQDDPTAGKAIGFMFIPVFNIYWMFFANLRLIDRIDEQRRFAGMPPTEIRSFFITMLILMFIPCLNIAGLVMFFVYVARMQSGINELVRVTRGPNV